VAPDTVWVAIGVAAIVLPAIVYGHHLHSYVYGKMFGDEILDVLDEIADENRKRDAADPHPKLRQGDP
jgi:hypothetical protein